MKYLLIIFLSIGCYTFTGCYSAKKATDQVNKADSHYPEIVAKLARDKYPCTDLLKPDTTIIYEDSIILVEIECPDQPTEVIRYDTVNNVITRTVRVPVNMPVQIRTVTKWYEDSAKLKMFTLQVESLQADIDRLRKDLVVMTGKRDWFRKYFYIELGILVLLLLYAAYRIWKNMTTFKIKQI